MEFGDITAGKGAFTYSGDFRGATIVAGDRDDKLRKCRNYLFLTDISSDRAALIGAKGERVSGTCEWIKEDDAYKSWFAGATQLLWISGGAGKGKTLLSIFLTQELELEMEAQTVYFFCANNDQRRNNAAALLRSLLWQLTAKCVHLTEHLVDHLDDSKKAQYTLETCEALWTLFITVLQDPRIGRTFCVLDGLDELDEESQTWLLVKLTSIMHVASLQKWKLVVVSQPILGLEEVPRIDLDLNNTNVSRDIQLFITARVGDLVRKRGLGTSLHQKLKDDLSRRAEITFLWLGFAMEELMREATATGILSCLETLPKGLPGIYSRLLLRIRPRDRLACVLLLHWITMAASPLSLLELAAATNIHASDYVDTQQAIRDRIQMCGSLVIVQNERVMLVHQSAKNYLSRAEVDPNATLEMFRFSPDEVHAKLASRCLSSIGKLAESAFGDLSTAHDPLARYAIYNWPEHARLSSVRSTFISANEEFFEEESPVRKRWWKAYRVGFSRTASDDMSALHIACYFGIVQWVKQLLALNMVDLDAKNEDGRTPMSWAAENGHDVTVGLLISTGRIDADVMDRDGETPLSRAVKNCHNAVVRQLLDVGKVDPAGTLLHTKSEWCEKHVSLFSWAASCGDLAVLEQLLITGENSADLSGVDGRTPLSFAAEWGHVGVVRQLLSTGKINAGSKDAEGRTPLSWAAEYGHKSVIQLLAVDKVDLDAEDKMGRTPLSWAAETGQEAVVRQLLISGKVNAESKDGKGRTPLSWAAEAGREGVVTLLLNTGEVDVDSKDRGGRTPLSWATSCGRELVVKTLLATNQVDTDSKDEKGRTPLSWAAMIRHITPDNKLMWIGRGTVVKLLLDTGKVNADAKDWKNRTPLSWAAESGHAGIVQQLLETGKINWDLRDKDGDTPLSKAIRKGHKAVVQLLLSTGKVDAELSDRNGRTLLSIAMERADVEVMTLLLTTGKVDADSKDSSGRTPLSWAAGQGKEEIVRLLLNTNGVNADSKDSLGRTPLLWAAEQGKEEIVRLLLNTSGVNADSKDSSGRTPLSWASTPWWAGRGEVTRLLLNAGGVNADSKDSSGRTPLSWAAGQGMEEEVRMLLNTGRVDANLKDRWGRTPLSWAAESGFVEVVRLLLTGNETESVYKDSTGWTPLSRAVRARHDAVVHVLRRAQDRPDATRENTSRCSVQ